MSSRNQRSRVVVNVPSTANRSGKGRGKRGSGPPQPSEWITAACVIGAAALATFVALFITSRPFDPMNSTAAPQNAVPQSSISLASPSPTPSARSTPTPQSNVTPSTAATPGGQTSAPNVPDDAAIQAEIEKRIFGDPALAKLDVSTIVEEGKVTLAGSVKSQELKLRIERTVRSVKGVVEIDNQLVITEATP